MGCRDFLRWAAWRDRAADGAVGSGWLLGIRERVESERMGG